MIISERQIMELIEVAHVYIGITTNDDNRKVVVDLLTMIMKQQSKELKDIK